MQQMTQRFPTPRLETDDGNQDLADLHAREDLLLEHYSWVDRPQGKVRIPIERAMEIIAQSGLAGRSEQQTDADAKMTAHRLRRPPLTNGSAPLTDGFARPDYEQEQASSRRQPAKWQGDEPVSVRGRRTRVAAARNRRRAGS